MAFRRILIAALLLAPGLASPAAAQPARETLTIGITQYPSTFHPNIDAMLAKSYVLGFARRPLTAYDPDWQLICMLCETLPTLENGLAERETTPEGKPGLRLTYRLREDAHWGDGTPVSAEDLRFAWEAGREAATGFGGTEFYRSAYALEVVDARTITLHLDKVTFDFASMGDFQPLPAHIDRARWQSAPRLYRNRTAYDTETTNPGLWNGPYRITGVQPGAGVTLELNPAWRGPAPAFRRIQIRSVENTAALEAQLLAGQLDMIAGELGLPVEQAAALERRTRDRFRITTKPGLVYEHLDLNRDNPALADPRVRQALLLSADRAQIVARLFDGRQALAATSVNPLDRMHDDSLAPAPYDPARAAALLDAAGWRRGPDGIRRNAAGERLALELMTTAGNRAREAVQQVLQGMWRQAGIEVRIRNEPPRVFFGETMSKRRFQGLALYAWLSAPESVPRTTLHSEEIPTEASNWSGQNFGGYRNPEMDRLIEAIPVELDREKRRALWSRLQQLYAEELPALPLWFRADAHIWPRWLAGVRPTGHLNSTPLWVEEWRVAPQ
ncbi:peptide ABC transporter substrate-binding protein [Siccirubricoccus sp. KC 17139]|uniref:Peptide ABC transporter substrate-binding protein n=1 Tax=Siccirubricoccus soli TaxID=2899147 RepID=A0ABT1D136_9PROT|nr:peptide ABC transporter substrate-binding protein [Siccirubricoccus soli]MCO6415627.1 peptide ABC transporter substrate-binding protein [Siccirubricoccus soli]MCP2681759.1 peptide ABC transporter substrate-binding protein [Siccirubricoccus soli]